MSDTDQHALFALRQNNIDDCFMAKLRSELAENGIGNLHLLHDEDILRLAVCSSSSRDQATPQFSIHTTPRLSAQTSPLLSGRKGGIFSAQALLSSQTTPLLARALQLTQLLMVAQDYSLRITTFFEGGKTLNYQALAGDGDGQGTSFGLIQWNFGQNTLGPLLKKMLAQNPKAFAACFGPDADYDTLKKALDSNNQANQLKWARQLLKNNKAAWSAAFNAIGAVAEFNRIQREQAAAKYHPKVTKALDTLRGIRSDLMSSVEFRSYAALFDLCVQQGALQGVQDIKEQVKKEKPGTQLDLLKIAVVVTGKKATGHVIRNHKSISVVTDCISRRMGILTGDAYESTENKVTTKRFNPNYVLITQHGTEHVAGL